MPAPRLAEIRRGLASVWSEQGRAFVTFEAGGDEDRWVQYIDGVLHLCWPHAAEPPDLLARRGVSLPAGAFPLPRRGGDTAQIAVGDLRVDEVAALVDALLSGVLDSPGNEEVLARIVR